MSRQHIVLGFKSDRLKAHRLIDEAPVNARVEIKAPKRTVPQNDKLWACLTDVAEQVPWHGVQLTPNDWKLIFLDGLKREMRLVPNLDGTGFVALSGRSSSDLSKGEMSDLIELIYAFGAAREVAWSDPTVRAREVA